MPARILLVEDDREARAMLTFLLREEGFLVTAAEDGRAALQLIDAACPDLVITDLQMPNLDGFELIKALRRRPSYSGIPILVVSACCDEAAPLALAAGANSTADKPVQIDCVVDIIKHLLCKPTA
ncbi:MAG TPA: response regulator [Blastocatellia bacterium]|nr:response regulator [Blastocatellia bacterium]